MKAKRNAGGGNDAPGAVQEPAPDGVLFSELLAVAAGCGGLLTALSLLSYDARDMSLNVSGGAQVHNWIGPAGAYGADFLLQFFGMGAYVLALGLLLTAWRFVAGRRLRLGWREVVGTVLLLFSIGAFAQLMFAGHIRAYPPGGVTGAILAGLLRRQFATTGAYILAITLILVASILTADGLLAGLGWRGANLWYRLRQSAGKLWHAACQGWRRRRGPVQLAPPRVAVRGEAVAWELAAVRGDGDARGEPVPTAPELPQLERRAPAEAHEPAAALTPPPAAPLGVEAGAPLATVAPGGGAPPASRAAFEPHIVDVRPRHCDPLALDAALAASTSGGASAVAAPVAQARIYELPSATLLDYEASQQEPIDPEYLRENAVRLTKTLKDYGIDGHVREIRPGPVVTMYEYVPGPGIKLSKIAGLADDLAMSMEALRVRIVAPIPGKGAVGIEIPNESRETVYLKEIIADDSFRKAKSRLTVALGKDIEGNPYVSNLAKMPHLLVAGATGAGKSVSINGMIMSLLFQATPDEVRLIMVDPKMLELSVYEGVPHLLLPVVTDPKKAALALRWAVEEMERRYQTMSELAVRSVDGYNKKVREAAARGEELLVPAKAGDAATAPAACAPMPYIVVIVDELADLMMVASRDVETCIMRLAQMARAAGIHLILATQRPSVDVITGVIKANFPTRIAFQVASKHDSRTIIDTNGAEHLLGRGDMLFQSPGAGGMVRIHGAYVSEEEIERTVAFWRAQGAPTYDESILAPRDDAASAEAAVAGEPPDEMYDLAVSIVAETRQASVSMIQRRLRIGYNRAARLVERMETEGIVGAADGAKPREVLIAPMSF